MLRHTTNANLGHAPSPIPLIQATLVPQNGITFGFWMAFWYRWNTASSDWFAVCIPSIRMPSSAFKAHMRYLASSPITAYIDAIVSNASGGTRRPSFS